MHAHISTGEIYVNLEELQNGLMNILCVYVDKHYTAHTLRVKSMNPITLMNGCLRKTGFVMDEWIKEAQELTI